MQTTDCAIIAHPEHPETVLLHGDKLPQAVNPYHFWQTVTPVCQTFRRQLGADVYVLRPLHTEYDDGQIANFYALALEADWTPPAGWRWVERRALPPLDRLSRQTLDGCFAWLDTDHPHRPDWYHPGWKKRAATEAAQAAQAAGYTLAAPVEQIRCWGRSAVLRLPTDRGSLYYKAVPPMFAHEPPLTDWLFRHYPATAPEVIARWENRALLLADYGGAALVDRPDVAIWEAALRRYARLQIDLSARAGELRALGVPSRGLDWINERMKPLLADDHTLRRGHNPLPPDEIAYLRTLAPRLDDACRRLADSGIPDSLEHGDLWSGQIIARDAGFVFTDWSDSALTHPFLSLPFFLEELPRELPDVPDTRARLEAAYLGEWSAHLGQPMKMLRQAGQLAALVYPLASALLYQQHILPKMEFQWEMENMLAYYFRALRRAAERA